MKIYAYSRNSKIDELDPFIGQDIWIPVGWKDDFYGWIKPLSYKSNNSGLIFYKSKLIKYEDVLLYNDHIHSRRPDTWQSYVEDYIFPVTHFDMIGIDHAVVEQDLNEEFDAFYNILTFKTSFHFQ